MNHTVNLNLLRSLKVLLEERHVSHAAQRLHLTQSAMSRHLGQLRETFADPLLVRDGNTLIATPKALQLQQKLAPWFAELDGIMSDEHFDPQHWHDEFVFASSDYVAQYLLPDISQELMLKAPRLTLSYRLWQPELIHQLHEAGIHLASSMSLTAPEDVSSQQIGEDHSVCLMGARHPLASVATPSLSDFLDYSYIKIVGGGDKDGWFDAYLAQHGQTRRIALNVPFFFAAVPALHKNELLLITPEHIARQLSEYYPLTYRALPVEPIQHKYWLLWHPKYDLDPAHTWARSTIERIMKHAKGSVGHDNKS